jgi:hypothetical protein
MAQARFGATLNALGVTASSFLAVVVQGFVLKTPLQLLQVLETGSKVLCVAGTTASGGTTGVNVNRCTPHHTISCLRFQGQQAQQHP